MEFRLLGPVEAFDGDQPVDLGPPKQRLILAALALTPGRTVPLRALIDRVWDDAPASDVRSSLHSHISRLRRALGTGVPVDRRSAGYVLRADPGQVDVARFRDLVADGRRRAATDPEAAIELLREAVGLWRGVPLADLSGRWVEQVRNALDQQRLEALVSLGELELNSGQHHDLVGKLTNWTEEYPFSEPLAGLLMRALVRVGRRAEALAHFARVRGYLVAELGEGPGRVLQELHERVLRRDPELEFPGEDRYEPAAPAARPAELPAASPIFVGRLDETDWLCGRLTQTSGRAVPVVAIAGAAGMGKSALAVQVAHAVADKFPDGTLYANLHGSTPGRSPADPVDVLGQYLRSLGYPQHQIPTTLEDATARFRSATTERRLLLLVDDAVDAAQVRPLIPSGPGSAVLVTSRRVLATLDAATHLHLRAMAEPDALELLTAMVSPDQLDTGAGSIEARRRVVQLCGRLPLAVRIAAARLAAHPEWDLSTLAGRLSDTRRRLDELQYGDLDIRASFAMSTAGLEPAILRLFELLGLLDLDHITVPVAAAVATESPAACQPRLDALVEAQLLTAVGPGRYALHDLIRLFARELADANVDPAQRDDAIQRAHHHYLATTRNAAAVLAPAIEPRLSAGLSPDLVRTAGLVFGSRTDAAEWVDREAMNLVAVAEQAAGLPQGRPVVVALSAAAAGPLNVRGQIRILTQLAQLAVVAAEASHDEPGLAQAHNDLAIGYWTADRLDIALEHAELALRAWSQAGDLSREAATLNNIGIIWARRGDTGRAVDYYGRALDIRRRLGHTESQAAVLANMAESYAGDGEFEQAFACLEESLELYRREGVAGGEWYALGNLGKVHLQAGDPVRAIPCLERAVELVEQSAHRHFEADFRWHLGAAHDALGHAEPARTYRRQALGILQQAGTLTAAQAEAILADPSPETPQQLR